MDNSTHFSILNTTEFDVDNDKLFEQICNLLLESGYYRVRLTNLLPFDKILGGLAWGVSSTYYPLEVDLWLAYSEYATMGLKLQVAEGVCNALKEMKCPKPLQPHQITGLDFGTIYPVVVWLMEMVNSARLLMGDKLRSYAEFVYKKYYKPQELVVVYRMNEEQNEEVKSVDNDIKALEEEFEIKKNELERLQQKKVKSEKYFMGMRSTVELIEDKKEHLNEVIEDLKEWERNRKQEEDDVVEMAGQVEEIKEEIRILKEECKIKRTNYLNEIERIKQSLNDKEKLDTINAITKQYEKEVAKIDVLKEAFGKRKRVLREIEKKIDEIPGKYELQQYHRQLVYLSIQTSVTLIDTRYYYEAYNCLVEVRNVYNNQIKNIQSITNGLPTIKNTKGIQQLIESIIQVNTSLQTMLDKEQTSLKEKEINVKDLTLKLEEISYKETEFYALVKQFEKEIILNEKIENKIQELTQSNQL